jgi:hypothetical protein
LHLPNPISNEPPRPNNGFTIFLERIVLRDFVGVSCEATCWLGDVLDIKNGYKGFFAQSIVLSFGVLDATRVPRLSGQNSRVNAAHCCQLISHRGVPIFDLIAYFS